jgi:hypothetical protein
MNITSSLIRRQEQLSHLYSPSKNEVYTPLWLPRLTLDKTPVDWSDPKLKFVDGACKSGIFLSEAIIRLMEGLKPWEPDEQKRYDHIIKNMIFGYAYTALGYKITKKLLYGDSNYACDNIEQKLFNKEDLIVKFDGKEISKLVILGNPPFSIKDKDGKILITWRYHVKSYLELLKKYGGFLGVLHPSNGRKLNDELLLALLANQIHYLSIYSIKDSIETFHCNMRFDAYVLEMTAPYKEAIINDELGNIISVDLKGWNCIPNFSPQEHRQLFATEGQEVCDRIIYSSSMYSTDRYSTWKHADKKPRRVSATETDEYKYPIALRTNENGRPTTYYANQKLDHFVSKVICNLLENLRPYNDFEARYGLNK